MIKKKAAIYARISTQMQKSDRQVEDLQELAQRDNFEVVDIYKDVLSGFKDNELRSDLTRLKADAKAKKFDYILFSEFSRLSRKVGELTTLIDLFRSFRIEMYFQKQNVWVKDQNDLGTSILIQVLGVVSQYEIELFAERSVSGKISAIKDRGINLGGMTAFGYESQLGTKKLIVNEDEAKVVKRIFSLFTEGYKSLKICDLLNAEGVASPYGKRTKQAATKRDIKGVDEKIYSRFDPDTLVWTPSSINKLTKNELYKGIRVIKMHKPDPTKTNSKKEILEMIRIEDESLRIIDDATFEEVREIQKVNSRVKNTPRVHQKLLSPELIKCGICGSSYVTTRTNEKDSYTCRKTIRSQKTRQIECHDGMKLSQEKVDGLVIALAGFWLAQADIKNNSTNRIQHLEKENINIQKIIDSKKIEQAENKETWLKFFKKAVKFNFDDEAIKEEQSGYNENSSKLQTEIQKHEKALLHNQIQIKSLLNLKNDYNVYKRMDEIKNDKVLIKSIIEQYIQMIVIYPLFDKYGLVSIKMTDDFVICGIVKAARYRNDEIEINPKTEQMEKITNYYWDGLSVISYNPTDKTFTYNREPIDELHKSNKLDHTYKFYPDADSGTYSAKDWIEILKDNDMYLNFSYYKFDE